MISSLYQLKEVEMRILICRISDVIVKYTGTWGRFCVRSATVVCVTILLRSVQYGTYIATLMSEVGLGRLSNRFSRPQSLFQNDVGRADASV